MRWKQAVIFPDNIHTLKRAVKIAFADNNR